MNQGARGPLSLVAGARTLGAHSRLARDLTWREISGRYRGSWLGIGWAVLQPMLLLATYTFVFAVVFGAKWSVANSAGGRLDFALFAFVGVLLHGVLAEVITKSPGLILANANYVKRVIFPLDILPVVMVGSAAFHALVALAILLCGVLASGKGLSATALWIPVLIAPLLVLSLGLAWLLAALGVYLRDLAQAAGVVASVLMFLAPVFYPLSSLPAAWRNWLYINPLTFVIEQVRRVIFEGVAPDVPILLVYSLVSLLVAQAGYAFFQRSRGGFADVV